MLSVPSLRNPKDPDACIKWGTLRDLAVACQDPESQVVLNALSLPMGDVSVTPPPKYRYSSPFICLTSSNVTRLFTGHWLPMRWPGKPLEDGQALSQQKSWQTRWQMTSRGGLPPQPMQSLGPTSTMRALALSPPSKWVQNIGW